MDTDRHFDNYQKTPCLIVALLKFIWQFAALVYKKIHSEQRLMCGLDAAIAVGVGYFTQSPWIGMVTGGVLVALNIELVSKRILKLYRLKQNRLFLKQ